MCISENSYNDLTLNMSDYLLFHLCKGCKEGRWHPLQRNHEVLHLKHTRPNQSSLLLLELKPYFFD